MNSAEDVTRLFHQHCFRSEGGRHWSSRAGVPAMFWLLFGIASHYSLGAQVAPPTLSVHRLPNHQLELRLSGQNLSSFSIERSLDLRTWQAIASPTGDASPFILPIPVDLGRQFFRAVTGTVALPPVVPVLDMGRASTVWIMPSGGVVEAEASNGTRFRLVVPENALLSPQQLTLTPVASIGNLPFTAGFAGGVDLQPHGLRLLLPAVLEVFPGGNFEPGNLAGFSYGESGGNVQLVPLTRTAGQAVIFLNAFSGFALAVPGAGERENIPSPACASGQALRQIGFILDDLARRQAEQGPGAVLNASELAELRSILAGWHAGSVLPWAGEAQSEERLVRSAAREFAEWRGWVLRLLGGPEVFQGEIGETSSLLEQGYLNALGRAEQRCGTGDAWGEAARMLAYAGEYIHLFNPAQATATALLGRVQGCASFELEFELSFYQEFTSANKVRNESVVKVEPVPLRPDAGSGAAFSGEGSLEYLYFHHDVRDCASGAPGGWLEASWNVTGSTFRVVKAYREINPIISEERAVQAGPCGPVPDLGEGEAFPVILLLDPGRPQETIEWQCFDHEGELHSSGTEALASIWKGFFDAAHRDEHLRTRLDLWDDPAPVEDAFFIQIPDGGGGGEVMAEKLYIREWNFLQNPVLEDTRLIIRRAPVP